MPVDVIELLKRMAGHGGRLHTFLLKKLQIPWSNESLGYNVKVYRDAETLARARVCPPPATDLQNHFVVTYREIRHAYRFHKTFGFKVYVLA